MSLINVLLTLDITTEVRVYSANSGRILGIGKALDVYNDLCDEFLLVSASVIKMFIQKNALCIYVKIG